MNNLPNIDFKALSDALLPYADDLVPQWLPGGVQSGHEYKCANLHGGAGESLSVNLNTGLWADFATDARGGDLVSLYACIHSLDMGKAAVILAREHGLESVAGIVHGGNGHGEALPKPAKKKRDDSEGWKTVVPVPDFAPEPTFWNFGRKAEDIEHTAQYQIDGALYGYVVRFRTSDGGKVTLPYTWCTSARDGTSKWNWKTWGAERPLYFPAGVSPERASKASGSLPTVVLVEGEKKACILHNLLQATAPGVYSVASWSGGCKAWKKSDWHWLKGCTVLLWPDCDCKPALPPEKQPGMAAMLGIGALLQCNGCAVHMLPIPAPGAVPDGWDCADAIQTDGWDGARVLEFFGRAQPMAADAGSVAAGGSGGDDGKKIDRPADAGGSGDAFQDHLNFLCDSFKCKVHELAVNRKMIIAALRKAPALAGILGTNKLTGASCTLRAWPFREEAGPLQDTDDLLLGDWLCSTYHLKGASRAALMEAIQTVADQNQFHPICDWIDAQVWDGKVRIDKWLIHVLGLDPEKLKPKYKRYLELVGKFMLMGLVARVMNPGCKFDYSPVLEGVPGRGKSTFVKTLVGNEFFSDTHFELGVGNACMEQLDGIWGYELSELTALRKADSEQVKQFFSSTVDRFRGAYGRYVQQHPRQCVIFCSTNKKRYLYDLSGNRRFWPIWIEQFIKLDWLQKYRGQLFAEALTLYRAGERYYPSPEEEDEFFVPEQYKRLVETAVQSRMYDLLTRDGAPGGDSKFSADINVHTAFITLDRIVAALGADAAKSGSSLESQINGWFDLHGWVYKRESTGQRRRGFQRPKVWPPVIEDDEDAQASTRNTQAGEFEGSDDDPF